MEKVEKLKQILGENEVERALQCICRNAHLELLTYKKYKKGEITKQQFKEANKIIKNLGPDKFQKFLFGSEGTSKPVFGIKDLDNFVKWEDAGESEFLRKWWNTLYEIEKEKERR